MTGSIDDLPKLTLKQQKFVAAYLETANAAAAYRRAYDCENMKPRTIMNNAGVLLRSNAVSAHVQFHRGQLTVTTAISAGSLQTRLPDLLAQLEEAYQLAKETEAPGAMVAAVKEKAKLLGLDTLAKDKRRTAGNVSEMSADQLETAINQAKKQLEEMERVKGEKSQSNVIDVTPERLEE